MNKRIIFNVPMLTILVIWFTGKNDICMAQTAAPDSSKKSFGLFDEDKIIEISLHFDLSTYFKSKPKEDYLKASITINAGQADSINRDIRLRTRGVFRNQYCYFPPIELNFKKANFGYTDLDKISKIKLVPQCNSGKDNEDYVLREYIAYKLFNVLTDTSFRVRLLKITYIDTQKKRKPIIQFGFFIEPSEMLIARTNTIQIKTHTLTQKSIVPKVMDRFAIFNYMIGNYDWAVPNQHNVLVVKSLVYDAGGLAIAIPHDFDWTGLVNPTYAIPAEIVGTENVRERLFQGICRTKAVYQKDLETFVKSKDEFYKVINDFPYVNKQAKKDMTDYLNGFFDKLEGKRDLITETLINSCKNF